MPSQAEILSSLQSIAPGGRVEGVEYVVRNPRRADANPGSFKFNLETLVWADFATDDSGKGLASYAAYVNGTDWRKEAINYGEIRVQSVTEYECLESCTTRLSQPGRVKVYYPKTKSWGSLEYECAHHYVKDGLVRRVVLRIVKTEGGKRKKTFTPIRPAMFDNKFCWVAGGEPNEKFLYNCDDIEKRNVVIFVAGEKKCDQLANLFRDMAVVTWSNGDKALFRHTIPDLDKKTVILWPDNDASSIEVMREFAKQLTVKHPGKRVRIVNTAGQPQHWDCGDAIDDGWDREKISDFIKSKRYYFDPENPTNTSGVALVPASPWSWVSNPKTEWVTNNPKPIRIGDAIVNIDVTSLSNCHLILRNFWDERNSCRVGDYITYNLFEDKMYIVKCPPWEDESTFEPHEIRFGTDVLKIRMWLERIGMKIKQQDLDNLIAMLASDNVINPLKDYFESIKWDRKKRLENWLIYYAGCEFEPAHYVRAVGKRWLIGAVARIYKPGIKFDTALVLEGRQGAGKSTMLKTLGTFRGKECFTDENIKFNDKDSVMVAQGKIIIEIAEGVAVRQSEAADSKSFISRGTDRYRPPYGRNVIERKRMFVLAITDNPDGGGLFTDVTGNRRYWPVRVGDSIDIQALENDKEQIWAEAVYYFKQGEQIYLTDEEEEEARVQQALRMRHDDVQDDIARAIRQWGETRQKSGEGFSMQDIMDNLHIPHDRRSPGVIRRYKTLLYSLGYEERRMESSTGMRRLWYMKKNY